MRKQTSKTNVRSRKQTALQAQRSTPEERVFSLYAQGSTFEEIAEAEHISAQEAVNIVEESKERAETLQAIAMQSFIKANRLDKRGRIEAIAALNRMVDSALQEADLNSIPPEKLVTLKLRLIEMQREEIEHSPTIVLSEDEQKRQEKVRAFSQFSL